MPRAQMSSLSTWMAVHAAPGAASALGPWLRHPQLLKPDQGLHGHQQLCCTRAINRSRVDVSHACLAEPMTSHRRSRGSDIEERPSACRTWLSGQCCSPLKRGRPRRCCREEAAALPASGTPPAWLRICLLAPLRLDRRQSVQARADGIHEALNLGQVFGRCSVVVGRWSELIGDAGNQSRVHPDLLLPVGALFQACSRDDSQSLQLSCSSQHWFTELGYQAAVLQLVFQ